MQPAQVDSGNVGQLYSAEQKRRRDASRWTLVQGILAPLQFVACLISIGLVWRYLATGTGGDAATISVVVKTLFLYAIIITGSLWERDVYGQFLFAKAFFWEDVVSMLVMALHTAYLLCLFFDLLPLAEQLYLALAAYAAYAINAAQFLWKFRLAKRQPDIIDTKRAGAPGLAQ